MNHETKYQEYGQSDDLTKAMMYLKAVQMIDQLEAELEQAKERIIKLQKPE